MLRLDTGNRIYELLDFKLYWGACLPEPPSGHSRLLHLQWPLTNKVIETPVSLRLNIL